LSFSFFLSLSLPPPPSLSPSFPLSRALCVFVRRPCLSHPMYIHKYIFTYAYIHANMYVHIFICICTSIYSYIHSPTTCMCLRVSVLSVYARLCACVCVHEQLYVSACGGFLLCSSPLLRTPKCIFVYLILFNCTYTMCGIVRVRVHVHNPGRLPKYNC